MNYKHTWLTMINKSKPGFTPKSIGDPNDHELRSLIKIYTNHDGRPTNLDKEVSKKILTKLSNLNAWLACSCHSKDELEFDFDTAPILFSRKVPGKSSDGITLMHAKDRPPHHAECPFFSAQDIAKLNKISDGSKEDAGQNKMNSNEILAILKPVNFIVAPMDSNEGEPLIRRGSSRERQAKLSRILLTLMDEAGLTSIDQREFVPSKYEQLESIRKALAKYHFDEEKRISVQKFTKMNLESTGGLCLTIKESSAWLKNETVPQGFLIGLAKSISGSKLTTLNNVEVDIDTPIILSGQKPVGPYIVIVLVGSRYNNKSFSRLRAFAQPVFSESILMPVDSDYERQTLRCLLSAQVKKCFSISKPVIDMEVIRRSSGDGANMPEVKKVRPDFILNYDTCTTVVVETMGYDDDEYVESKKRTHPFMKLLGQLIEHRPNIDSDEKFLSLL